MITERAMLAAVHISIWTAVKHDRKVSRQVADEHGAPETAWRYNKKLLSGAARLADLRSFAGQIRQSFYKITLPWSDEGYRLLPAHAHDGGQSTSSAYLLNDFGQPSAAGLRVFDTPHLLTSIDHETIRNTYPHLIFDERAIRKVLDSVICIYLAPSGRLFWTS
jgi:hypothetical protein